MIDSGRNGTGKGIMDNPERFDVSNNDQGQDLQQQVPVTRNTNHAGRHRTHDDAGVAGGLFWLFATTMLALAAWFLGPLAIERFQYAATKGRVTAEYDNAREMLNGLPLHDVSQAFELVAQRIKPSVVSIRSSGGSGSSEPGQGNGGQGSGVIMSEDGYIVTNEHVVAGASFVKVDLHDRRQFDGVVVGQDTGSDLAVIKIEATGLLPADWGDSDSLSVGSMVWAVGSPYGLEQTVTSGILSAKERGTSQQSSREYLQTDAAVNPGNSGGPLVNARGEVVGINTSIFGEQFLGISFAIPSSIAKFVFEQISQTGKVTRSYLGVRPRAVRQDDLSRWNLPDLNGAVVDEIPADGPASNSPLQIGDVIRKWNGKDVRTFNTLYSMIAMTSQNSVAKVDVLRNGQPLTLEVQVVERPPEEYLLRQRFRDRRNERRRRDSNNR